MTPRPPSIHPFNDDDADLIVRSSDGVNFYLHRIILAKASPVFRDMFLLPAPPEPTVDQAVGTRGATPDYIDGMFVVRVTEDERTMNKLLHPIYPIHPTYTLLLEDVARLLEASRKYQLDGATGRLKVTLMTFVESQPLRVFVVAYLMEFEEEARTAARVSLRSQVWPLSVLPAELRSVPAAPVWEYLRHHSRCTELALAVATDLSWVLTNIEHRSVTASAVGTPGRTNIDTSKLWVWFTCGHCDGGKSVVQTRLRVSLRSFEPRAWWKEYMDQVVSKLKLRPVGSVVKEKEALESSLRKASTCPICAPEAFTQLSEFSDILADRIDRATAQVSPSYWRPN